MVRQYGGISAIQCRRGSWEGKLEVQHLTADDESDGKQESDTKDTSPNTSTSRKDRNRVVIENFALVSMHGIDDTDLRSADNRYDVMCCVVCLPTMVHLSGGAHSIDVKDDAYSYI